jgi:Bacteriocin-protection, YdeI or OmpD-Associated
MCAPRASASTSSGCAYSRSIRSRTRRSLARSRRCCAAAGLLVTRKIVRRAAIDAEPRVVAEPADFARALDADSVVRTADHRLSCSRKREHVLAIESAKAETRVRRIEKALAMLRYQESAEGRAARAKP